MYTKYIFVEAANDIQFYDAVEDLEELSSDEDSNYKYSDPRLTALRNKLTTMYRKRAHYRNKKV